MRQDNTIYNLLITTETNKYITYLNCNDRLIVMVSIENLYIVMSCLIKKSFFFNLVFFRFMNIVNKDEIKK